MEGFKRGDPDCFRKIVEHHQQAIATFCLRYVGATDVARDLTQDVFLTLWRERKRYQHQGKLKSFLLTIARNRCLAHLKKERKVVPLRVEQERRASPSDPELLRRDLGHSIRRLPPDFGEILVLRYLEDMDLKDIADLTHLPLGTVKSRLHRALEQLRRDWHD